MQAVIRNRTLVKKTAIFGVSRKSMLLLVPLNVGTARREDSPEGMLLPGPTERNIRRPFLSDVVLAK